MFNFFHLLNKTHKNKELKKEDDILFEALVNYFNKHDCLYLGENLFIYSPSDIKPSTIDDFMFYSPDIKKQRIIDIKVFNEELYNKIIPLIKFNLRLSDNHSSNKKNLTFFKKIDNFILSSNVDWRFELHDVFMKANDMILILQKNSTTDTQKRNIRRLLDYYELMFNELNLKSQDALHYTRGYIISLYNDCQFLMSSLIKDNKANLEISTKTFKDFNDINTGIF